MKRFLPLTLLLGALFGLLGQQAALATGPAWQSVVSSASNDRAPMNAADCEAMMDDSPEELPCTGLTLDCIAAMGCVVPMTLVSDASVYSGIPAYRTLPPEAIFRILAGRDVPPEPEPPTLLI